MNNVYYINSDSIKVFPSTGRGIKQPSARLLSEKSFTSITYDLIDFDGYVMTKVGQSLSLPNDGILTFIIGGYYFEAVMTDLIGDLPSNANDIYATIKLKTVINPNTEGNLGTSDVVPILQGQDSLEGESYEYQGLSFTSVPYEQDDNDAIFYSLKVLTKQNGVWVIPEESIYKINTVRVVDGGIV